ncbi:hypothetical protein CTheo_3469 [Ceratobasidium theobromae]|uniref:Uncharacterized protein n=1 Tax=Ceratobasidium theobromae TaxID=1582974 RepID=A0A5N5QPA3_9AGAM|nr:hypothetical protein CTheo_3469 [Ceratobasidium theobromae]
MEQTKSAHPLGATPERRQPTPTPPPPRQEKESTSAQPSANGTTPAPPAPPARHPHRQPTRSATIDLPGTPKKPTETSKLEPNPKITADGPNAAIHERDVRIRELEERIRQLEIETTDLQTKCACFESEPYRDEVLSIRVHLQVNDLIEPWEVSQKFGEIVRQVEDISRNLGEVLSSHQPIRELKTDDFLKLLPRRPHENQPPTLPTPSLSVEPEDFVDYGCRALINEKLFYAFLGPQVFHPILKQEENRIISRTYEKIRKQESQVIAGRWRVSTFQSHGKVTYNYKELALQFFETQLGPFCKNAYGEKACEEAFASILPAVTSLFERTVAWNFLAKQSVVMLDFHPSFSSPGSFYDPQTTALEGRRTKPPSSKTILLTSKLGLWSSRAIGDMKDMKDPEYTVQTKATVLTAEYFA